MNKFFKNLTLYQVLHNSIIAILLIFFYYKIFIEYSIPVSGDELNSILVYSSNLKTLLLKNFPGNVVFFHFIGYVKSQIIGYDLISYKSISYLLLILHFIIFKKIYKNNFLIIIFLLLTINTNLIFYSSYYMGYFFSSLIYVLIFYLLKNNKLEQHNKWILFLLFLQTYNHLVNIYLAVPIMASLFIYSDKKKFIKESIYFYLIPTLIFYFASTLLTGASLLKINDTSLVNVLVFTFENFYEVFFSGINRILFYEAYNDALKFNFIIFFKEIFLFDKIFFLLFFLSILISIYNLKFNKINKIFSFIIIFHLILFFLINKLPAPRILAGFVAFYVLLIYSYIESFEIIRKIVNLKILNILILSIIFFNLYNLNYLKKVSTYKFYRDITFKENKLSLKILSKKCALENQNFSEIQKRNFYFNYLNICDKKYDLNEFLKFYRS